MTGCCFGRGGKEIFTYFTLSLTQCRPTFGRVYILYHAVFLNASLSLQAATTTLKHSSYIFHTNTLRNHRRSHTSYRRNTQIWCFGRLYQRSSDSLHHFDIFINDNRLLTPTKSEASSPTMSFFEQKWDPTIHENLPPQVNAWRNGEINTASSPGYTETSRKAQNSASGATIVDGKILKPVHARPKENLPSNVHGFHDTSRAGQSVKHTGRHPNSASSRIPAGRPNSSAMSDISPSNNPGRSTNTAAYAGSTSHFSGPDFIPNRQSSSKHDSQSRFSSPSTGCLPSTKITNQRATKEQKPPPSTEHISQTSPSEARKMLPHHLRSLAATKTAVNTSVNTQESESSGKMNAGKASRPIKFESNFPCTYEKCTRGFMNKKAFKDHKEEEHDYCRVCDEDYDDGDKLLEHKVNSDNHICCGICGQDFRSEAGRDKHVRQVRQIDMFAYMIRLTLSVSPYPTRGRMSWLRIDL